MVDLAQSERDLRLWRVRDRAGFAALRQGRRARHGPVTVTWAAPDIEHRTDPPMVAFAVGRRSGGAVARNRIRRRLRSALRQMRADGALPSGRYLISGTADLARIPWSELVSTLADAVDAATHRDAGLRGSQ